MFAFVITIWRRDGSFHRFVRVAPFAALAVRAGVSELYETRIAVPGDIEGVSATKIEHFDAASALEQWAVARHTANAPHPYPAGCEPVPARVLH